jgi:hypothetical protein
MRIGALVTAATFFAIAPMAGFSDVRIADPSAFTPGTDVSETYADVTLSTAVGSMVINGTDVSSPLTLISDATTPVYTTGSYFYNAFTGSIWSAGQCCGGTQVLRADFHRPVFEVAVTFIPDDTDTGILQIYDKQNRLLGEAIFRGSTPFTLTLETPNRPIAYALATFGDTGRLGSIAFLVPPRGSNAVAALDAEQEE